MSSIFYLYISKSWSVAFVVATLQLSHISIHLIIIFLSNFPIIVFNIYIFFNIYTFSNLLTPLPFHLSTTLYINIIIPLSLHLPLFCLFWFIQFYYKFVTIPSILCIVFSHKKCSLSFSLTHTHNLWVFYFYLFFYFFLHLCFRLINFCVF